MERKKYYVNERKVQERKRNCLKERNKNEKKEKYYMNERSGNEKEEKFCEREI